MIGHMSFTLRHLIVGLGRAPRGDMVQVERLSCLRKKCGEAYSLNINQSHGIVS